MSEIKKKKVEKEIKSKTPKKTKKVRAKRKKRKAKIGRPSKFTKKLADKICAELAIGNSLRTVCDAPKMPTVKTIFNWFRKYPDFLQQYTRAKQESADAMADEILDIADDGTNDYVEGTSNNEHIQRSRLRVDTRKWLMAKMKPKKYGDKLDLTTDGKELPAPIYGGRSKKEEEIPHS